MSNSSKTTTKTSRRSFQQTAIASLALIAGTKRVAFADEQASLGDEAPTTCEAALQRLMKGHHRFVSGQLRHPHVGEEWRTRLSSNQNPFATILGCSDSRVPPEMLFDQGFGDLFVVRVAGNVIDTDVQGSVEYGVDHLSTLLVVVMGHDGCGAVTAALKSVDELEVEPSEIQSLVKKIRPAISSVNPNQSFSQRLRESVEANVRASVRLLLKTPDLQRAVKAEKTKIIGCVYSLDSGQVRMLDT